MVQIGGIHFDNAVVIVPDNMGGAVIFEAGSLPEIGFDSETMQHLQAAAMRLANPDDGAQMNSGIAKYHVMAQG